MTKQRGDNMPPTVSLCHETPTELGGPLPRETDTFQNAVQMVFVDRNYLYVDSSGSR